MAAPAIRVQATDRQVTDMFNRMDRRFRQSEREGRAALDTIDKHSRIVTKGLNAMNVALAGIGYAAQRGVRVAISEFEQFDIKLVRTQNIVDNMTNRMRNQLGEYARMQAATIGAPGQSVFGSTFTGMSGGVRGSGLRDVIRLGAQANIAYGTDPTETVMRLTQAMAQTKLNARDAMNAMVVGADIGQTDFGQLAANLSKTTVGARLLGIDQRANIGMLGAGTMFAPSTAEAATQQKALYAQAIKEDSPFAKEFKKTTGIAFLEAVQSEGFIMALSTAFSALGANRAVSLLGSETAGPYASSIVDNVATFQAAAQAAQFGTGFSADYLRASDTLFAQRRRTGEAGRNLLLTGGAGGADALQTFLAQAEEIFNDPRSHDVMEALAKALGNFLLPAGQLASAFNTITGPLQLLASAQIPTPGGGISGLDVGGTAMGLFAMSEMKEMINRRRGIGGVAGAAAPGAAGGRKMKIILKDDRMRKGMSADGRYYGPTGVLESPRESFHTKQRRKHTEQKQAQMRSNIAARGGIDTPVGFIPYRDRRQPWHRRAMTGAATGLAAARGVGGRIGGGIMTAGMWGMGASMVSGLFGQITGFDPMQESIDRLSDTFAKVTDSSYEARKSVERFNDMMREVIEEVADIKADKVVPTDDELEDNITSLAVSILGEAIEGMEIDPKDWTLESQVATLGALAQGEQTHMAGSVFRHLGVTGDIPGTDMSVDDVISSAYLYKELKDDPRQTVKDKAQVELEQLRGLYNQAEIDTLLAALPSIMDMRQNVDLMETDFASQALAYALSDPTNFLFDLLATDDIDKAILDTLVSSQETLEEIATNTATYTSIYQTVGYTTPSPLYQEDPR